MLSNRRSKHLQSPKLIQKKRKKMIWKVSLFSILGVVSITLLIIILNLGIFNISKVEIEGETKLPADAVKEKTLESIKGKYLGLISRSSLFLYSKSHIEEELKKDFYSIESLEIDQKGLTTISLNIKEKIPYALVCEGFHEEGVEEKCFYVDKDGYVFGPAPEFSSAVYLHFYIGIDKKIEEVLGTNFIDSTRFKELLTFAEGVAHRGISVIGMLVGADGSYELYIKNKNSTDAIVYFDDRTPFDKSLSNFVAFWDNAMSKKIGTSTIPAFDYINLRFGNNIFYVAK